MVSLYKPDCLSAQNKNSIAYYSLKERLPVIIARIIDHLNRDRENITKIFGVSATDDVKDISNNLSLLKREIEEDKPLTPFNLYFDDIYVWNACLFKLSKDIIGESPTWCTAPWLFVESYMYRRIYEVFRCSLRLRNFDYFRKQKEELFMSSIDAVLILGNHLLQILRTLKDVAEIRQHLSDFLTISLWSNRCDMAITAGGENPQSANPLSGLRALQQYILINNTEELIEFMIKTRNEKQEGLTIDFILDNAGFELFSDLCLAHFLCAVGLANKIHFYIKKMPFFVSDATAMDIMWIMDMIKGLNQPNEIFLEGLTKVWNQCFDDMTWTVETEAYWTYPLPFSEMKERNPMLYLSLSKADLLIFKGDLNYRKLTNDRMWHTTTLFDIALCGFNPSPLCVLRCITSDIIVGLATGQANAVGNVKKNWLISGEFAVIQFTQTVHK